MKQFLAVYTGSNSDQNMQAWNALDEKTKQSRTKDGMEGWEKWGQKYQKSIVFAGGPLGKTKQVDKKGIADIKNLMAAYTVVQADSHEDAAKMFLEHPHFSLFPGAGVEVMECLPVPTKP